MSRLFSSALLALVVVSFVLAARGRADEGMWLYNQPPRELLKKKYGFELTDEWLERAQKATIRFNNGGTGAFVSANGLVVTNHHIGASSIQKLSTKEKNYYRDGFYAPTRKDELKCPDLELNVLESIEDVTERVRQVVKPGMSDAEAAAAKKAEIARIERESLKQTGLRSDVVTLYQGGLYHLYRSKRYTDVRLVFAPEEAIAHFGGDVDNFEYPRYCLDVCFFRVYENGKPLRPAHHFHWSTKGPSEGDLVFVSGNPGTTNRLETVAHLKHRRDVFLPYMLGRLRHLEALLQQYSAQSPENARQAAKDLYPVANARKAYTGQYLGLLDPAILRQKAEVEQNFKLQIKAKPEWQKEFGHAWDLVAKAQKTFAQFEVEYQLLEKGDAFFNRYFTLARHLVRLAEEQTKPNDQRLPEYTESSLASLRLQLFSPAPIAPELEQAKLAGTLAFLVEKLGGEHPVVVKVLAGKAPADRAAELVQGTRLGDVAFRKQLAEGGTKAIAASDDPMIRLALLIDSEARKLRKRFETEVQEPQQQGYALLAKARFALFGPTIPPDATFTLRLAFGTVQGYEVEGKKLPFFTTFGGAFERAAEQLHREPFRLPQSWVASKERLDLNTPFNFVSTADTIGGNSGSPVLNRAGELIGLNFDRNRHGLVRNFIYTDHQARHISVHCRAVLEALRKVYTADDLLRELTREER